MPNKLEGLDSEEIRIWDEEPMTKKRRIFEKNELLLFVDNCTVCFTTKG